MTLTSRSRFSCLCAAMMAALAVSLSPLSTSLAGPLEVAFLQSFEGRWIGLGRAATTQGETPVECSIEGRMRGDARISLQAQCRTQGQSGRIDISLYFNDMTQQFHGELSSPLSYISGGLHGRLSRGDLFLRLAARDGSEGRLLVVAEGPAQLRLLVTTIVDGASITVFDLPLVRPS